MTETSKSPSIPAPTLAAGSYDFDKLNEGLSSTVSIEDEAERQKAIDAALSDARAGSGKEQDPRHIEGDKFVTKTRKIGEETVTEKVQVFDAKAADEAAANQEETALAGEAVRDRSSSTTEAPAGAAPRSAASKEK